MKRRPPKRRPPTELTRVDEPVVRPVEKKPSERGPGDRPPPRPRLVMRPDPVEDRDEDREGPGRRPAGKSSATRRPTTPQRPAAGQRPASRQRPKPAIVRGPGRVEGAAERIVSDREKAMAHVAPIEVLARAAVHAAASVEPAVLEGGKHADRGIAKFLRERHDLGGPDRMFVSQAVFALFRWKGWLDPMPLENPEARLLYAWLLDAPIVHPACKVWARALGKDPARMFSLGGAPSWTARAEGWKRLHEGQPTTVDPWRLFPAWLREHIPLPPGESSPKLRYLELLNAIQSRPSVWVRAQGIDPKRAWAELGEAGVRPWLHRRVVAAARLNADANVHHLDAFKRGFLEIQDLASQAVGLACDPDPGERWWDACAGAGGKALHLSALMNGKGLVVATDVSASKLKETVRRARRSPFRNVTTKPWDGKHVAGKAGSFDGVLVDAPCSALGTWRRNPDARWTLDREAIPRLAATQAQLLRAAAPGVKPGGTLVYSVCTLTPSETYGVVRPFLAENPGFKLDPFPHPLSGVQTDGTVLLWPQEADNDAMFVARMIRST